MFRSVSFQQLIVVHLFVYYHLDLALMRDQFTRLNMIEKKNETRKEKQGSCRLFSEGEKNILSLALSLKVTSSIRD